MSDDLKDDATIIDPKDDATTADSKDDEMMTNQKNFVKTTDLRKSIMADGSEGDLMTSDFFISTASQRNRGATLILIGLLVFGVLATIFAFMWPQINGQIVDRDVITKIPRVTTNLESSGNPPKSVTAIFAIETDTTDSDSVDGKAMANSIKSILAEGDYEMLMGRDSVNYAKWLINEKLPDVMDVSKIKQMYLLDLQVGDSKDFFKDEPATSQPVGAPRGLFPNLQFNR